MVLQIPKSLIYDFRSKRLIVYEIVNVRVSGDLFVVTEVVTVKPLMTSAVTAQTRLEGDVLLRQIDLSEF